MPQSHIHLVPAEYAVDGQRAAVLHDMLMLDAYLVIDVIADEHIHALVLFRHCLQAGKHALEALLVHPVIGIDNLEIAPRRVGKTGHHRVAVSAVFLVDGANDAGMAALKPVGDFRRPILGTIVNDEDFNVVAAGKQRFNRVMQIILRIVARNGNRQQFHLKGRLFSSFGGLVQRNIRRIG